MDLVLERVSHRYGGVALLETVSLALARVGLADLADASPPPR
jgi:hypothetical protein